MGFECPCARRGATAAPEMQFYDHVYKCNLPINNYFYKNLLFIISPSPLPTIELGIFNQPKRNSS